MLAGKRIVWDPEVGHEGANSPCQMCSRWSLNTCACSCLSLGAGIWLSHQRTEPRDTCWIFHVYVGLLEDKVHNQRSSHGHDAKPWGHSNPQDSGLSGPEFPPMNHLLFENTQNSSINVHSGFMKPDWCIGGFLCTCKSSSQFSLVTFNDVPHSWNNHRRFMKSGVDMSYGWSL